MPLIVAGVSVWGTVAYFVAAIGGFTDMAGNRNRALSALCGFACLALAVPISTFIVLWLKRPARVSVSWPRLSKRFEP